MNTKPAPKQRNLNILFYVSSALVCLLGLIVLVGWYTHNALLIQVFPQFAPMQYNTALGFLLTGLALLLISRFQTISAILGLIVFLIGSLTLIQYIYGINFGIDQLLMKHYITVETSNPGRMAPNTALCFALSGAAIVLTGFFHKSTVSLNIALVFSILVAILGFIAFFGYISNISTAYGWGNLTRMAVHTSIGFLVVALALHCMLWNQVTITQVRNNAFFPILVFIMTSILFALFWSALRYHEENQIKTKIQHEASFIKEKISTLLNQDIKAIQRLYSRINGHSFSSKQTLTHDINYYLSHIPSIDIIKLSHNKYTNKGKTFKNNKLNPAQIQSITAQCHSALNKQKAGATQGQLNTAVTQNLLCLQDSKQHLAILNITTLLKPVLNNRILEGLGIALWQDNRLVFHTGKKEKTINPRMQTMVPIKLMGLNLEIEAWPRNHYNELSGSLFPLIFLIFGIGVSLLLSIMIRLWQTGLLKTETLRLAISKQENSENTLRMVVESSPQAILIANKQGEIVFCNRRSTELWGYGKTELLSRKIEDLMPERFRKKHVNLRQSYTKRPVKRQMGESRDLYILTQSEKEIPVEISLTPLELENEPCVLASIMDVSAQKRYEERLTKQAQNIQLIYDATTMISEATDLRQGLQTCLDLICETLHWPVGHIYEAKQSEQQTVLKSSGIWFMQDIHRTTEFKNITEKTVFNKGAGLPGRIWASRKSAWITDITQDSNFPRAKSSKNLHLHGAVGFPIIVQREVVAVVELFAFERRERDDELLRTFDVMGEQIGRIFERWQAQDELETAETRNRLLLESAGEGIFGLNKDGIATFANPAAERMLGYLPGELIGQPIHETIQHHRANGSSYPVEESPMEAAFHDGQVHKITDELLWRKDGSSFVAEYISTPIYDNQVITGAVVTFKDITKQKAAEKQLQEYTENLEKSNQALDDFAYIASHDLKEPLRGINNFSSFLLEDYQDKLGDEGKEQLKTLQKLSQRMESLINTLLQFSRVGRLELAIQKTDIQQIIEEKKTLLNTFLKENHAHIILSREMPIIYSDKTRIGELFQNLIINGIKYNDNKEKEITIDYQETNDAYIFSIKDNGIGIPKAYQAQIFKIFKRLHARNEYGGGTGAGMTIAQKIVERHRGKIWLESEEGAGTTFYFSISKFLKPNSTKQEKHHES